MQAIDIKLLRDFGRLWIQGLAIALVLAAGVAVILMSAGMSGALKETRDTYYDQHRFADVFAAARRAPDSLAQELRDIPGVADIETQVRAYAVLDIPGRAKPATGLLISRPEFGEARLNLPLLRSGRWPETGTEVVVNEPFAEANGFAIGSTFSVNLNGRKRALTITGTALSPEFIYTIGPGALMPQNETFGILWMQADMMDAAFNMAGAFDTVSLALLPRTPVEPVKDAVQALLEPYGGRSPVDRSGQQSNAFLDAEITQLEVLAYVLPPIFLGITVFLVNMVIGRIVFLERAEIGLMKAVGYSDWEVCLHYLMLAALIALVGIGIGWVVGTWLAREMAELFGKYYDFPFLVFNAPTRVYVLSALLGLAATSAGALRSALQAARMAPAVAMAPPAPPRFRRSWLDVLATALSLSQPTRMILRSLVRWPMRAAMTMLGMALAVSVLVASNFFPDAVDEIIDKGFYQSNRQDMLLLFDPDVPVAALDEVRRMPGVLQAEPQQYHAAVLRRGPYEKQVAISTVSPDTDLARVIDQDGDVVIPDRSGILLSDRLAAALHVTAGDIVTAQFESGNFQTFDIPVSGVVTQFFGLGAYLDHDAMSRLFEQAPRMSAANVTLADPGAAEAFEERIKEFPVLSGTINMTENRQSFLDTLAQNILIVTAVYAVLGTIITVGVAYNGARVQLSERARELASLRILGFSHAETSYILAGEILLLALLAQPLGWWIGTFVAKLMTDSYASDLYAIPLVLMPATYARASLIVLAAAVVSVAIVTRRLNRLDLISVMKTRE
ncbi:FtsX-like permease family protein [Thalassococcus sp. CAU 1522]|uniref:FtsX-like permease family protein n=1 Tax=Thalassococcus arenae TaxID=2851652 RepID=A0ABS6N3U1_9RHOB|nr:FtsX-like permease family protein [Thalassococcus arenae]MBV2358683.1 FtsX-like permease family protein [Thalassococcus arenae]